MKLIRLYSGIALVGTILYEGERPAQVLLPAGAKRVPPHIQNVSELPPADPADVYRFVREFAGTDAYTKQGRTASKRPPSSKVVKKSTAR